MKERTKAYLAGLIDADGKLSICRHVMKDDPGYISYSVVLAVSNTYRPVMNWLVEQFGGYFKKENDHRLAKNETWNQGYLWLPSSSEHASKVLSYVLPYLVIKRKRGEIAREFFKLNGTTDPEARKKLFDEYKIALALESVTPNTFSISWKQNLINAYLGGFFDGEGSTGVYETRQSEYSRGSGIWYKPRVSSGNSVKAVPELFQKHFGGGLVSHRRSADRKWEHAWSLTTNKPIERFLLQTLPYLIIKREQSKMLLEFVRLGDTQMPEHRKNIVALLKEAKR